MNDTDRSTDEAFIAGIHAAPLDHLPRLVYADWLDERGDERAELLRLECSVVSGLLRLVELREQLQPEWVSRVELLTRMFVVLRMPHLGEGIQGGTILVYNKRPGQIMAQGGDMLELDTEKATVHVPAEIDCVAIAHLVPTGQYVPVGGPLALVLRQ